MKYLSEADIILINRKMLSVTGEHFQGEDNLHNPHSFRYLVIAPQMSAFGVQFYPTVYDKAAVYMYLIIEGHVFTQGNKRTGLASAINFLELNGFFIKAAVTDDIMIKLARDTASNGHTIASLSQWFSQNTVEGIYSQGNSLIYSHKIIYSTVVNYQ